MAKVTTTKQAGMFFGHVDGENVCGPYMNKGMAVRQANRIAAQAPKANPVHEAARTEGRKMGLTEAQIERFIARQS